MTNQSAPNRLSPATVEALRRIVAASVAANRDGWRAWLDRLDQERAA